MLIEEVGIDFRTECRVQLQHNLVGARMNRVTIELNTFELLAATAVPDCALFKHRRAVVDPVLVHSNLKKAIQLLLSTTVTSQHVYLLLLACSC